MATEEQAHKTSAAITVVAREILTREAIRFVEFGDFSDLWEDYPAIGEDDWNAIGDAIKRLAGKQPANEVFQAAYAHLQRRADSWQRRADS